MQKFKQFQLSTVIKLLLGIGTSIAISTLLRDFPIYAQNSWEDVAPLSASELAKIREAPFSKMFFLENAEGEVAYAIKDRDFQASNSDISLITLWGDVPDENILQVILRYCLSNRNIAKENAHLREFMVLDGKNKNVLFKLEKKIASTTANTRELSPAGYALQYYSDPFYDPYWSPFYYTRAYSTAIYVPAVECSFGGSRFDLLPVKEAISQLPNQTLNVRLIFSNGIVENWRLGKKTIQQLKELPTIKKIVKAVP